MYNDNSTGGIWLRDVTRPKLEWFKDRVPVQEEADLPWLLDSYIPLPVGKPLNYILLV